MAATGPILRLGEAICHPNGVGGTLGAFLYRHADPSWTGLLSVAAVVLPPRTSAGDYIHLVPDRPGQPLSGFTRIATVTEPILSLADRIPGAGVAELLPGIGATGNRLPEGTPWTGAPFGPPLPTQEVGPGTPVVKVGAASNWTEGRVVGLSGRVAVGIGAGSRPRRIMFENLVAVSAAPGEPFSLPGDGGALVLRAPDLRPIGLVFAAQTLQGGETETLLLPLPPILQAFDVGLVPPA